ncbi:MAG: SpoIIE family protein phosphatase [Chitinophagales bacterium]|nr:SpoIIE family protein phosphatase [Chitinophagales bacterium]
MKSLTDDITRKLDRLEEQLQLKERELNSLLQITQAINSNISSHGLLRLYQDILVKQIGIGKVAVFIYLDEWQCTNATGIDSQDILEATKHHLPAFRQITRLAKSGHPLESFFDVVVPVYHKDFAIAYTFLGDFSDDFHLSLDEKLSYIQTVSNVIAVAIENKRLFRAQMKQGMLKSELELAGKMQTMLIPGNLPDDERISIAGVYLPFQQVGGDYYDYIELNREESIFCIGDISGKGVAAALLMANFQASVRSYAEQQPSLSALIRSLNGRVNEITNGEKFITFFIAKFNFTTRELQYINAGHNPALLFYDGEVKMLQEGCTILGMFEKLPYVNLQSLTLKNPFVTFCYTDGLTDVENEEKQSLDISNVIRIISDGKDLSPTAMNKKIVDYLVAFKGSRLINDDVSMLTCHVY